MRSLFCIALLAGTIQAQRELLCTLIAGNIGSTPAQTFPILCITLSYRKCQSFDHDQIMY